MKHHLRFWILIIGFLVLLLVPLFFLNIQDSHDWGDDFAQYILQAKNLAEGKPQTEGAYIFNPDYPFYAPPVYPVGYPILLAPIYKFFGNDLLAFNYFQTLLLFLFGIVMFFFLRRFMSGVFAVLLTLLAVYNPWMLEFKTQVIADLPFALFVLLAVMCYLNFKERVNWKNALLAGFFTGFAILIKPLAFLLIGTFIADIVLSQFREREIERETVKHHVALLLAPVLVYFCVTYVLIPSSVETTAHFHNLYNTTEKLNKRFNINAEYYMTLFQDLFRHTNPDWDFSTVVIKAFALTLFLLGFFGKLFNRFAFAEIFTLLFLLLVLFFPNTTQGFRYLLPVLPFLFLYIYHGFESIRLGWMNRKVVFIVACVFCLFQYKTTVEKMWKQDRHTVPGPQEAAAREAFEFIENNTDVNAVIAFIKPRALSLYAQRKSLTNHPQQSEPTIQSFFERNRVTYYLVTSDLPNPSLDGYLTNEGYAVEVVWSNGKFTLLKRLNS